MADTEVPNLAAIVTPADADVLHIVNGGVSKKISLQQLTAYLEERGRRVNASVANQAFAAADTYIAGSFVTIPAGRLQAKSIYRLRMQLQKTSTTGSTATPIATVRLGTAGTTADTARATLTFPAQTAVADDGFLEVFVSFRTVGSGTAAVISSHGILDHRLASTGLVNTNTGFAKAVSAGFDSTVAGLGIGVSFNGGTSFAGNTDLVQAELLNLG
jgi:hypothetical protein